MVLFCFSFACVTNFTWGLWSLFALRTHTAFVGAFLAAICLVLVLWSQRSLRVVSASDFVSFRLLLLRVLAYFVFRSARLTAAWTGPESGPVT